MVAIKIIASTVFIMITLILTADFFSIWSAYKIAKEKKIKYEKRLDVEMVLLFSWSMLIPNTLDVLSELVAMVSRNMMYRCSKVTNIARTVVSVLIYLSGIY